MEFLHILNQKDFGVSGTIVSCFSMGIKKDIDMISFYSAALVLCRIYDSVNQDLAAVGNNPRVYGNRMVGGCDSSGTGVASPSF